MGPVNAVQVFMENGARNRVVLTTVQEMGFVRSRVFAGAIHNFGDPTATSQMLQFVLVLLTRTTANVLNYIFS